jgi:hypothetical protein
MKIPIPSQKKQMKEGYLVDQENRTIQTLSWHNSGMDKLMEQFEKEEKAVESKADDLTGWRLGEEQYHTRDLVFTMLEEQKTQRFNNPTVVVEPKAWQNKRSTQSGAYSQIS